MVATEALNTKETLVEAKNLILVHGWIQGEAGDSSTGYCIMGALSVAAPEDGMKEFLAAKDAVRKSLKSRGNVTDVSAWNDADHRTKEDVLNLLDEAASGVF